MNVKKKSHKLSQVEAPPPLGFAIRLPTSQQQECHKPPATEWSWLQQCWCNMPKNKTSRLDSSASVGKYEMQIYNAIAKSPKSPKSPKSQEIPMLERNDAKCCRVKVAQWFDL